MEPLRASPGVSPWCFPVPGSFQRPHSEHSLPKGPCSSSEGDRRGLPRVLLLDTLCSCFINWETEVAALPCLQGTYGCAYHARTTRHRTLNPFAETHAPRAPELTSANPSALWLPIEHKVQNLSQPCLVSAGRTLSVCEQKTIFWFPVTIQVGPHPAAV